MVADLRPSIAGDSPCQKKKCSPSTGSGQTGPGGMEQAIALTGRGSLRSFAMPFVPSLSKGRPCSPDGSKKKQGFERLGPNGSAAAGEAIGYD